MQIQDMIGKTFTRVESSDDEVIFLCDEGKFIFNHHQDCCEWVRIESIVGNLQDLVGSPLLLAEEATSNIHPNDYGRPENNYEDSLTWTFYKFATIKGYVDIRWLGESNGYYSESVDLDFYACK